MERSTRSSTHPLNTYISCDTAFAPRVSNPSNRHHLKSNMSRRFSLEMRCGPSSLLADQPPRVNREVYREVYFDFKSTTYEPTPLYLFAVPYFSPFFICSGLDQNTQVELVALESITHLLTLLFRTSSAPSPSN